MKYFGITVVAEWAVLLAMISEVAEGRWLTHRCHYLALALCPCGRDPTLAAVYVQSCPRKNSIATWSCQPCPGACESFTLCERCSTHGCLTCPTGRSGLFCEREYFSPFDYVYGYVAPNDRRDFYRIKDFKYDFNPSMLTNSSAQIYGKRNKNLLRKSQRKSRIKSELQMKTALPNGHGRQQHQDRNLTAPSHEENVPNPKLKRNSDCELDCDMDKSVISIDILSNGIDNDGNPSRKRHYDQLKGLVPRNANVKSISKRNIPAFQNLRMLANKSHPDMTYRYKKKNEMYNLEHALYLNTTQNRHLRNGNLSVDVMDAKFIRNKRKDWIARLKHRRRSLKAKSNNYNFSKISEPFDRTKTNSKLNESFQVLENDFTMDRKSNKMEGSPKNILALEESEADLFEANLRNVVTRLGYANLSLEKKDYATMATYEGNISYVDKKANETSIALKIKADEQKEQRATIPDQAQIYVHTDGVNGNINSNGPTPQSKNVSDTIEDLELEDLSDERLIEFAKFLVKLLNFSIRSKLNKGLKLKAKEDNVEKSEENKKDQKEAEEIEKKQRITKLVMKRNHAEDKKIVSAESKENSVHREVVTEKERKRNVKEIDEKNEERGREPEVMNDKEGIMLEKKYQVTESKESLAETGNIAKKQDDTSKKRAGTTKLKKDTVNKELTRFTEDIPVLEEDSSTRNGTIFLKASNDTKISTSGKEEKVTEKEEELPQNNDKLTENKGATSEKEDTKIDGGPFKKEENRTKSEEELSGKKDKLRENKGVTDKEQDTKIEKGVSKNEEMVSEKEEQLLQNEDPLPENKGVTNDEEAKSTLMYGDIPTKVEDAENKEVVAEMKVKADNNKDKNENPEETNKMTSNLNMKKEAEEKGIVSKTEYTSDRPDKLFRAEEVTIKIENIPIKQGKMTEFSIVNESDSVETGKVTKMKDEMPERRKEVEENGDSIEFEMTKNTAGKMDSEEVSSGKKVGAIEKGVTYRNNHSITENMKNKDEDKVITETKEESSGLLRVTAEGKEFTPQSKITGENKGNGSLRINENVEGDIPRESQSTVEENKEFIYVGEGYATVKNENMSEKENKPTQNRSLTGKEEVTENKPNVPLIKAEETKTITNVYEKAKIRIVMKEGISAKNEDVTGKKDYMIQIEKKSGKKEMADNEANIGLRKQGEIETVEEVTAVIEDVRTNNEATSPKNTSRSIKTTQTSRSIKITQDASVKYKDTSVKNEIPIVEDENANVFNAYVNININDTVEKKDRVNKNYQTNGKVDDTENKIRVALQKKAIRETIEEYTENTDGFGATVANKNIATKATEMAEKKESVTENRQITGNMALLEDKLKNLKKSENIERLGLITGMIEYVTPATEDTSLKNAEEILGSTSDTIPQNENIITNNGNMSAKDEKLIDMKLSREYIEMKDETPARGFTSEDKSVANIEALKKEKVEELIEYALERTEEKSTRNGDAFETKEGILIQNQYINVMSKDIPLKKKVTSSLDKNSFIMDEHTSPSKYKDIKHASTSSSHMDIDANHKNASSPEKDSDMKNEHTTSLDKATDVKKEDTSSSDKDNDKTNENISSYDKDISINNEDTLIKNKNLIVKYEDMSTTKVASEYEKNKGITDFKETEDLDDEIIDFITDVIPKQTNDTVEKNEYATVKGVDISANKEEMVPKKQPTEQNVSFGVKGGTTAQKEMAVEKPKDTSDVKGLIFGSKMVIENAETGALKNEDPAKTAEDISEKTKTTEKNRNTSIKNTDIEKRNEATPVNTDLFALEEETGAKQQAGKEQVTDSEFLDENDTSEVVIDLNIGVDEEYPDKRKKDISTNEEISEMKKLIARNKQRILEEEAALMKKDGLVNGEERTNQYRYKFGIKRFINEDKAVAGDKENEEEKNRKAEGRKNVSLNNEYVAAKREYKTENENEGILEEQLTNGEEAPIKKENTSVTEEELFGNESYTTLKKEEMFSKEGYILLKGEGIRQEDASLKQENLSLKVEDSLPKKATINHQQNVVTIKVVTKSDRLQNKMKEALYRHDQHSEQKTLSIEQKILNEKEEAVTERKDQDVLNERSKHREVFEFKQVTEERNIDRSKETNEYKIITEKDETDEEREETAEQTKITSQKVDNLNEKTEEMPENKNEVRSNKKMMKENIEIPWRKENFIAKNKENTAREKGEKADEIGHSERTIKYRDRITENEDKGANEIKAGFEKVYVITVDGELITEKAYTLAKNKKSIYESLKDEFRKKGMIIKSNIENYETSGKNVSEMNANTLSKKGDTYEFEEYTTRENLEVNKPLSLIMAGKMSINLAKQDISKEEKDISIYAKSNLEEHNLYPHLKKINQTNVEIQTGDIGENLDKYRPYNGQESRVEIPKKDKLANVRQEVSNSQTEQAPFEDKLDKAEENFTGNSSKNGVVLVLLSNATNVNLVSSNYSILDKNITQFQKAMSESWNKTPVFTRFRVTYNPLLHSNQYFNANYYNQSHVRDRFQVTKTDINEFFPPINDAGRDFYDSLNQTNAATYNLKTVVGEQFHEKVSNGRKHLVGRDISSHFFKFPIVQYKKNRNISGAYIEVYSSSSPFLYFLESSNASSSVNFDSKPQKEPFQGTSKSGVNKHKLMNSGSLPDEQNVTNQELLKESGIGNEINKIKIGNQLIASNRGKGSVMEDVTKNYEATIKLEDVTEGSTKDQSDLAGNKEEYSRRTRITEILENESISQLLQRNKYVETTPILESPATLLKNGFHGDYLNNNSQLNNYSFDGDHITLLKDPGLINIYFKLLEYYLNMNSNLKNRSFDSSHTPMNNSSSIENYFKLFGDYMNTDSRLSNSHVDQNYISLQNHSGFAKDYLKSYSSSSANNSHFDHDHIMNHSGQNGHLKAMVKRSQSKGKSENVLEKGNGLRISLFGTDICSIYYFPSLCDKGQINYKKLKDFILSNKSDKSFSLDIIPLPPIANLAISHEKSKESVSKEKISLPNSLQMNNTSHSLDKAVRTLSSKRKGFKAGSLLSNLRDLQFNNLLLQQIRSSAAVVPEMAETQNWMKYKDADDDGIAKDEKLSTTTTDLAGSGTPKPKERMLKRQIFKGLHSVQNSVNFSLPHNDWCTLRMKSRKGTLECTVWSDRKQCTLTCLDGYQIDGDRAKEFICYRNSSSWETEIRACETGSGKQTTVQND